MIVISDSNIIFSCFYTPNGVIASILKNKKNKLQFIAPSFLLEEVKEHLPEIMKDNLLTKRKANALLKEFTQNITFYELKDIKKQNRDKASKIAKNIDPDDYLFIALHFEKGHKIWTCDNILSKRLKEMGYDICISTQELKTNIYKKVSLLPKDSQNKEHP
ncbi:PIN domain-containing protein [Capnocytophaga sp. oral taxon 903]|uniref:PIN domain-containing protein n=1 Tax=Capnocytophaga sp. oral taxon 903 TaxID=2748317 RepID=UPI0015BD000B|nr:PIN domain-containing protein [Capnocytophaga sp. oral taxon 903]NWO29491.1 PIN domain nuclease [Capnocytophaga sp. oral taxon 903]